MPEEINLKIAFDSPRYLFGIVQHRITSQINQKVRAGMRDGCNDQAHKIKCYTANMNAKRDMEIVVMREKGLSYAKIGRLFDLSHSRPYQIVHKHNRRMRTPAFVKDKYVKKWLEIMHRHPVRDLGHSCRTQNLLKKN